MSENGEIYTVGKNFTPPITPNFNSFSDKNTKKWVKMEKFTLLPAVTAWSNLTSAEKDEEATICIVWLDWMGDWVIPL